MKWEQANSRKKRERGIVPKMGKPISEAIEKWIFDGCPSSKRSDKCLKTLKYYKLSTELYLEALGDHEIEDYSWDHAAEFERYLKNSKGLGPSGINCHQRQFQIFISWCHSTGRMPNLVKPPKTSVPEHLIKTFNRNQIEAYRQDVFKRSDKNLHRAFMLLLLQHYANVRGDKSAY